MKIIKAIAFALAAGAALTASAKATKGSCAEKPLSLKASQTATLLNEWSPGEDGEKGEYLDTGAAYYKVKLTRGQAYTIWIEGGKASDISLDVDIYWPEYDKDKYDKDKYEDKVPNASFDIDDVDGGAIKVAYLYSDDWDYEDDPKSGQYLVSLEGDIGDSTTLHFTSGIRTFKTTGSEDAPKVINMADKWKSFASKLVDDSYYFRASLKAGRRYRIRTTGGTKKRPLIMDVNDGTGAEDDDGDESSDLMEDSAYTNDLYNAALVVTPSTSGKYTFVIDGESNYDESTDKDYPPQPFRFYYTAVPKRAIASHPSIPLRAEACGDEVNGYSVKFVPGRVANTTSYYDEIIDEHLCRFYMAKGERWVFETTGATQEQEMRAYNSKGTVIATNTSLGDGTFDSRIVVTATAAGMYYIGVCDPSLDVYDLPDGGEITLTARNTAGMKEPDEADPADDVYTGATLLTAFPTTTNELSVVDIIATNAAAAEAIGATSAPHRLGANDLYDWFVIPCRTGYRYRLRATFADENQTARDVTLSAVTYFYAAGSRKAAKTDGVISPMTALNETEDDYWFKATANGPHYVRVRVAEGLGLDFPDYRMNVVVDRGESKFGMLTADIEGGVGSWYINKETAALNASGAVVTLSTNAAVTVKFTSVSGFVTPQQHVFSVPAWNPGDEPLKVTARYADAYDSKYVMSYTTKKVKKNGKTTTQKIPNYSPDDGDATPKGAFAIAPAATAKTVKRTLWADDTADCFSFTAAAGTYYDFTVASASDNLTLVVSNAVTGATVAGTPRADGTGSELLKQLLDAGTTYLIVSHGDGEDKDAVYSLTFGKATTGVVRFTNAKSSATTSFFVKEGTEYATLYVARTGSEGVTRVRYATQAGTALPGVNYYPVTDGVVTWKAGDKAAKAIKIRMIQDLNAHWAASNLTFSVALYPADEFDLASNEYLARTNALQEATVSIVEATAKKPGKISLASCDGVAVENAAKPAVVGKAGTTATLMFSRTGGSDGPVKVKVSTVAAKGDTAKAGVDYVAKAETLSWDDADDADKPFEVELPAVPGYAATKAFSLSVAVVNTDGTKPTLAAKTATFTIKNATVDQTAAAYAKTFGSAGLAFASTGTWFEDYDGTLRSGGAAGTSTFTLTGPGFFQCRASLAGTPEPEAELPTLSCLVDGAAVEDFGGTVTRLFASGKHTVKFILSGGTGDVCVKFENEADGRPYLWVPLSGMAPANPMAKAVVDTDQSKLAWTLPDGIAGRAGIYNRVRFGTSAKSLQIAGYADSATSEVELVDALTAGTTYYWAVDTAYTEETGLTEEGIAALSYVEGTAWTFSALADNAPFTVAVGGGTDAAGRDFAELVENGESVELLQGVKPGLQLDDTDNGDEKRLDATNFRLLGGTLPKGVSIDSTSGKLTGAPSTPGEYTALLQSFSKIGKTTTKTVNGKKKKVTTYTYAYGSTLPVTFVVLPAGTSVGTFRGVLAEDGGTFTNNSRGFGDVTFTATSAGKLTAKVTIAGIAYSFTGTGYDEILNYDHAADGTTRELGATLSGTISVTTTSGGKKTTKKYTNKLTVKVKDGATTNSVALAEGLASIRIDDMKVLNAAKTGYTADVSYEGGLYRNNGATDLGKAALADFAGYYTAALAPEAVSAAEGVPVGNGYLLITVAESGSVKVTGVLADGTSVSGSTVGQLVGADVSDQRNCVLMVPVCLNKAAYALAGTLQIAYQQVDDQYPVVLSSEKLLWAKTKAATTSRTGAGFTISQAPTGGWYDKVVNLQAYYINNEFALSGAESGEDLPAEALASGYKFSTESTPQDLAVKFTGNALSVSARKLVKNNTLGLYDFVDGVETTSVNPWNVTLKLTRATGVLTGKFSAWEWKYRTVNGYTYATAQKEIKNLVHKGVLIFSRDSSSASPLDRDALTAGFFLMPAADTKKVKWKASLPFNILTTDDTERSWDEKDFTEP